ncbi:MAG: MFS transporter [Nitratireductor sp.]
MPGIAALCVAYLLSQFYRSFLAVLSPVLAIDLSMTPKELAMASGAWFAAFALAQFPIGYGLDTWGPRRTAGILHGVAAGGGAAVFAMATTPTEIIIAMALIGVGCAPVLMAAFFLFARNFSARGLQHWVPLSLPSARLAISSGRRRSPGQSTSMGGIWWPGSCVSSQPLPRLRYCSWCVIRNG